jgi:hypothetical protein
MADADVPVFDFTRRKGIQDMIFADVKPAESAVSLLQHEESRTYGIVACGTSEPSLKQIWIY